ncbi:hypothetical protein C1H46_015420 [Malus baccata]|uniref:Uncharacterized protein n=1 Tax=Malus baccata TaxID=106549 RepID=A0A540MJJ3_MALBA|nr:hypothetical protein C1H46_015420 [Malus baccata]
MASSSLFLYKRIHLSELNPQSLSFSGDLCDGAEAMDARDSDSVNDEKSIVYGHTLAIRWALGSLAYSLV